MGPLWLLPSGPDQIHDPAMRGDPPLIGCALRRTLIIAANPDTSRCRLQHGNMATKGGWL